MICPHRGEKYLKFQNFKNQLTVPFVVYADTECLLEKVSDDNDVNTKIYKNHVPFSVA